MSGLLYEALPTETLIVAIDPGKAQNRVWLASGERVRFRCAGTG